jgi:glycosyltransferase involved in cell wall biosynthesis
MSITPDISVVMSVYNGEARLQETIDSILSQKDASFEFIIVDDGSTDQTSEILKEYAVCDSRVKLIRQENQGLTKALIKGCAAAKGRYIARQDAGDISLPGRLSKQFQALQSDAHASFISCGTKFVGPEGEQLYEVIPVASDLTEPLLELSLDKVKGPSMHGCTMFRADKYEEVGGYRASFYFAQDLDLWVRMAERGSHIALRDILYEASFTIGSISSRYRNRQVHTTRLILESARRRRNGVNDKEVLLEVCKIRPDIRNQFGRHGRANAMYFIGACLRQSRSPHATHYFRRALQAYPLHLRSAVRLLLGC